MKKLEDMDYHPIANKVVDSLVQKTQSENRIFYHILVAYYFTKISSMMRININTHDRGKIPLNMYAINLAPSGQGKGHSTNIIEEHVINQFKTRFLEETFPAISEINIAKLANKRANKKGTDPDEELIRVQKEFDALGNLAFSFDSGTPAAVKQMRHKLLMADAGSMNMEIDEIGSNLLSNIDVLNTFLELFDVGKIKQKLTKNTAENIRNEEIDGKTPTNMMLFGTPSKLLNGGKTEDELYTMLETGYARRSFFGYSKASNKKLDLTPLEIYDMLTDKSVDTFLTDLSTDLSILADATNFGQSLDMSKDVSLLLIEYKLTCEKLAEALPAHEEIRKAEVAHRYFKALKLAGTYAFIDGSGFVTEDHLYNAIKLTEESGKAFEALLKRERNYVKLARYIADIGRDITHVDLVEELPCYKGSESQKRELMALAIAYGYRNNIIIKKSFNAGIEFLRGESLKETDLSKIKVAYSTDLARDYRGEEIPFDDLHKLTQQQGYHWTSHHMLDGHRSEDTAIAGFNLVVLDIDSGVKLETAKLLLQEYKYLMYTTKRHTDDKNRFRIVLPISHALKMDAKEFKEFMNNVYTWLPFEVDTQTNQRSRKWESFNGTYSYNDGKLLDSLEFIPNTTKSEERKKIIDDHQALSNLERWFAFNTGKGNRSNMLVRYALMLVESGMDIESVRNNVFALNSKLPDKMDETEIMSTILVTASKAIHKRDTSI